MHDAEKAAETYLPYAAGKATQRGYRDAREIYTHTVIHLLGAELKKQLALYAEETQGG